MNKDLALKTFRNTTGAVIYIFLVSLIIQNGEKIFGNGKNILMPFVFLMLFSLSAAIVGGLTFGLSVMLFLEGKRRESVTAAIYSIGWLGAYTLIGLLILMIMK